MDTLSRDDAFEIENGLLWKIRLSATEQYGYDTKEREQFDNQLESDIRKVEGDRQSYVQLLEQVLESFNEETA